MQCKECEGRRGYQPLLGPWEACQACDGTGVSTVVPFEGPVVGFGELQIGGGVCTISAPSDGPFQFKDRLPDPDARVLAWDVSLWRWIPVHRATYGIDTWDALLPGLGDFWWRPTPPPPPGV